MLKRKIDNYIQNYYKTTRNALRVVCCIIRKFCTVTDQVPFTRA